MKSEGARIKHVRQIAGLTQEDFAKRLPKVSRGAVGNWERDQGIKRENLQAIATEFRVPFEWLSMGRGPAPEVLHEPQRVPAGQEFEPDPDPDRQMRESSVGVGPLVAGLPRDAILEADQNVGLGGAGRVSLLDITLPNGESYSAEGIRDWWRLPGWVLQARFNLPASRVRCFVTKGNSMLPLIGDGDVVFVDVGHKAPSPPGLYALSEGFGDVVVKQVEIISAYGEEPVRVRVTSANPAYTPKEWTIDEINIAGRYLCRVAF